MIKPKFYLNNQLIIPPNNWQELAIELNYDKDDPAYRGQVSTNAWEFGLGEKSGEDGAYSIDKYVSGGINMSTEGVFQGYPFRIDLQNGNDVQTLFDGYLDLSRAEYLCDKIVAEATETGGIDWLNESIDSFTFEELATPVNFGGKGIITSDDYVYVPYLIQRDFDETQVALMVIASFSILIELLDIVYTILSFVLAFISEPLVYALVTSIIVTFIRLVLVILVTKSLIKQIINLIYQKKKYAAGMYILDMCNIAAEYLGYEFASETILETENWRRVCILSEVYQLNSNSTGRKKGLLNFSKETTYGVYQLNQASKLRGFYRGTFGKLLSELKDMFNAKVIVDQENKILRLERNDYTISSDKYTLPKIDESDVSYRYNSEELISNYSIKFAIDNEDKHIWNTYEGTEYQVITEPAITPSNPLANLMRNEKVINIPYSLGIRKEKLNDLELILDNINETIADIITPVEKIVNGIINAVNRLIRAIAKIIKAIRTVISKKAVTKAPKQIRRMNVVSQLRTRVERRRLYVLLMEQDFLNTPKILMLNLPNTLGKKTNFRDKVKLSEFNREVINAKFLYEIYHDYNGFVNKENGVTTYPNQYKIKTLSEIPFCIEDYNKVKNNNFILNSDGITPAEIISLKWNIYKQTAEVTYKTKEVYTTNLKQNKIIGDGR